MIPGKLYEDYATAIAENDRQAKAALAAMMAQLDPGDVDGVRDVMLEAYPALVRLYGTRAAQVALEFYVGVREAQGVASLFRAEMPSESDLYDEDEAIADVRREVGGLYSGKSTMKGFTSTMQGLATKRTMQMADSTLYALAAADPAHPKVALVPHAGACAWCVLIGSRGFTNAEKAMENMRHDGCKCSTVVDFDKDNPSLGGYDPDAMYQLFSESCTDEDMRQWRAEWNDMNEEERAKFVRRARTRDGQVKEIPGDWSTFVRNRTVQNMNRLMRDPGFAGGHEEPATWLPGQRAAMKARQLESENPKAFGEWRQSVSRVEELKTSQSQRKHIPGTKEYDSAAKPSYFYVDESKRIEERVDSVRQMVNESAGSGYPLTDKNGEWTRRERVRCDGIIGVDGWSNTETSTMTIIYGDGKVHASPTYDGSGRSLD